MVVGLREYGSWGSDERIQNRRTRLFCQSLKIFVTLQIKYRKKKKGLLIFDSELFLQKSCLLN